VRRIEIRIIGQEQEVTEWTVDFANRIRLSVSSHEITRPPLEEFPWNAKMKRSVQAVEKMQFSLKSNKQKKHCA